MHFRTLVRGACVGSLALEAAATPYVHNHVIGGAPIDVTVSLDGLKDTLNLRRADPATHAIHERQMPHLANSWRRSEPLEATAMLPMRIGLKQRNLDYGHERLMAISDPSSPEYGQHMTADEVVAFFAPERSSVDAVVNWLTDSGIHVDRITQSANNQWIQFDASASEVEDLLITKYHVFEHVGSGSQDIAADYYHLPHEIRDHVDYITPGIRLRWDTPKGKREIKKRAMQRRDNSDMDLEPRPIHHTDSINHFATDGSTYDLNCTKYVTPTCITEQYNIPNGTHAAEGNKLGIFEALDEHYSKTDLDEYYTNLATNIPLGTYPEERLIDGATGATSGQPGSEANLDLQAAIPLIYPQGTVLFQVDDERIQANMTSATSPYVGFANTFYDAIDGSYCQASAYGETGNCVKPECLDPTYPDPGVGGYNGTLMCGTFKPTNVISISYGGGEHDLPAYYWKRQCLEILKLGLQGITVVISSGDYGVAAYAGDPGSINGCLGDQGKIFNPQSMATCPYVLAVGGTSLNAVASTGTYSNKTVLEERAARRFYSGGGFSNYFDRPWYQSSAVEKYFSTANLSFSGYDSPGTNYSTVGDGVYHTSGRGYPDVAAIGERYVTRFNGVWYTIGGTSLAAPIWASMLTLVNEERIAAGKRTLGFVNPALYLHPEVFNDITSGSNPGCRSKGFTAAEGWDPVTGLGSPQYPKLLSMLLSLP